MTNSEWFDTGKLIVIRGSVYNGDGEPQAGILVSMFDTNYNLLKRVRTNTDGIFRFAFDKTTFVYGTYNLLYGFQGVKPKFKYDLDPGDYDTLMIWNFDSVISGQAANPWSPNVRYLKGAIVSYDGSVYQCVLDDPELILPTNSIVVGTNSNWQASGALLAIGRDYLCVSTGTITQNGSWGTFTADGEMSGYYQSPNYPLPPPPAYGLIGQIGKSIFQLGTNFRFTAPTSGELCFTVNDDDRDFSGHSGQWYVTISEVSQSYPPPTIDTAHWQLTHQGIITPDLIDPSIFYAVGN